MDLNCEVVEMPGGPSLCVHTRAPAEDLPKTFEAGFTAIAAYLGELGETPTGPPFTFYFNMDMEDLEIEFGFPVSKELPGKANIQPGKAPAGRAATCLHIGPYAELPSTYGRLMEWVQNEGLEPTGVMCEQYLNSPCDARREELKTQLSLFVK
jgi:effector-binding domain-containing protein